MCFANSASCVCRADAPETGRADLDQGVDEREGRSAGSRKNLPERHLKVEVTNQKLANHKTNLPWHCEPESLLASALERESERAGRRHRASTARAHAIADSTGGIGEKEILEKSGSEAASGHAGSQCSAVPRMASTRCSWSMSAR